MGRQELPIQDMSTILNRATFFTILDSLDLRPYLENQMDMQVTMNPLLISTILNFYLI